MLIAGDIGGTKTDMAIFSSEAGPHAPVTQGKVHSADYPSLQAIVKEFRVLANATGTINITFTSVVDNAMVNGIEVVTP